MRNKKWSLKMLAAAIAATTVVGTFGGVSCMAQKTDGVEKAGTIKGDQAQEGANVLATMNSGFTGANEDGSPQWWWVGDGSAGSKVTVVDDATAADQDGKCVKVEQNSDHYWDGVALDVSSALKDKTIYGYSFYVKLEKGAKITKVAPVINRHFKEDYSQSDRDTVVTAESEGLTADGWTKVSGTFTYDNNPTGGAKAVMQHLIIHADAAGTFYVDGVSVWEIGAAEQADRSIEKDVPDLKTVVASKIKGAKSGVCISPEALEDSDRMELVCKHFNSITCENQMKPDAILGYAGPTIKKDAEGKELTGKNGDKLLELHFEQADQILDYIVDYNAKHQDAAIGVRGHVLVWHSQTPEWFFHEDYDISKPYVSKAVMLTRMENYIKDVMDHFDGADSKYKGLIYAWDVVNEQIEPGNYDAKTNKNSIRTEINGEETGWHHIFGGSDAYIRKAFVYANKYAPKNIKLFYNDYGDADATKSTAISKLLKRVKKTKGARISGMGMQAHYDMTNPTMKGLTSAVRKYSAVVDEVQFTEMDIASSKTYNGTNRESEYVKEGYRYQEIFQTLAKLNKEKNINITGVTLWGTDDGHTWLGSPSSVGGGQDGSRPQAPLLFDENYKVKPAFWGIVDATKLPELKEEDTIKKPVTLQIKKGTAKIDGKLSKEWKGVKPQKLTITTGTTKAEASVRTMWDSENLYVLFEVKDPDVSKAAANPWEQDSVEVFLDQNNHKSDSYEADDCQYRVNFDNEASFNGENCSEKNLTSKTVRTKDGYRVELAIKWNGKAPKAGDKIGLEFQVNDGSSDGTRIGTVSWYDETGMGYAQPGVFGTAKLMAK